MNIQRPAHSSHQRTRESIVNWILTNNIQPGDQLPPQAELVKHLSCSETTVQKVMRELVEEDIIVRGVGRGTFLVRLPGREAPETNGTHSPVSSLNVLIAVLDLKERHFTSPAHEMIETAEEALAELNPNGTLKVEICHDAQTLLDAIARHTPDAMVVDWRMGIAGETSAHIRRVILDQTMPVISCCHLYEPGLMIGPCITLDDTQIGRMGINYLVENGHNNIGLALSDQSYAFQSVRKIAAKDSALGRATLTEYPGGTAVTSGPEMWLDMGANIAKAYLNADSKNRPTAFFALNDKIALGLVRELQRNDIQVPEDVSVIGVDNDLHTSLLQGVNLTSIDPCRQAIGEHAIAMLIEIVSQKRQRENEVLCIAPRLRKRQTVATLS